MNYPCRCGAETSPFEPCPVCEPKTPTTGEWTSAVTIAFTELQAGKIGMDVAYRRINAAHNAAIAAAQGAQNHMEACRALLNVPDDEVLYGAIKELQQQLDAEEQKVTDLSNELAATRLASRQQLAAEKEKVDNATENCMSLSQLLYADREKVQRLEKLLRSMPKSFGITEKDLQ